MLTFVSSTWQLGRRSAGRDAVSQKSAQGTLATCDGKEGAWGLEHQEDAAGVVAGTEQDVGGVVVPT